MMKKAISLILSPIRYNVLLFAFLYLQGIANTLIECYVLNLKIPRFNFLSWIFDLYLACCLLMLFPRKIRSWISGIIATVLYFLSIINTFCVETFHARIGPEILNVVIETNPRESSEFVDNYIHFSLLFSCVGIIILIAFLHIITAFNWSILRNHLCEWIKRTRLSLRLATAVAMGGVIGICTYICLPSRLSIVQLIFVNNIQEVDGCIGNFAQNTPFNNLIFAIKMRQMANNSLTTLAETQKSVKADSCSFRSENIVLIIGESYIKCHSQLYGYDKPTTPLQLNYSTDSTNGHLVAFNDVISPSNLTSTVFKHVLSMHSVEDTTDWAHFPLFPVLFKKAGYDVTLITNQFVKSLNADIFNISGGLFINENSLSEAQFSHRNTSTHRYDEGLLTDYDSLKTMKGRFNLHIFHLAGQHIDFFKRSPEQWKKFSKEDYSERNDLSDEERQLVADYDNATLYNDYVVNLIIERFQNTDAIVIYMPDHGEECFDELHRMGRMPGGNFQPEVLRQEYRIPFWIWYSAKYKEMHPDIVHQIVKAKNKPFMTDDLSHLLLYLAGIQSEYYQDERNPLSETFNVQRKRLIGGNINYDDIVK